MAADMATWQAFSVLLTQVVHEERDVDLVHELIANALRSNHMINTHLEGGSIATSAGVSDDDEELEAEAKPTSVKRKRVTTQSSKDLESPLKRLAVGGEKPSPKTHNTNADIEMANAGSPTSQTGMASGDSFSTPQPRKRSAEVQNMHDKYKANRDRTRSGTTPKTNPPSTGTATSGPAKAAKQQSTKPQPGASKGSRPAKSTACAGSGVENGDENEDQDDGEELSGPLDVSVQQAKLRGLLNNGKKQK